MSAVKPQTQPSAKTFRHATLANAPQVPGRRKFFTYRDLGVTEASAGELRAQVMTALTGMTEPPGWHYHACDGQFVYALKGWVDLDFATGESIRVEEGQSLFIPGGLVHNETATADELEILEVCVPSELGTVPVDAPPGMKG